MDFLTYMVEEFFITFRSLLYSYIFLCIVIRLTIGNEEIGGGGWG